MPTSPAIQNTNGPVFSQSLSFFDPTNASNRGSLITQQANPSTPQIASLNTASGMILPDKPPAQRTDHFPEESYDLDPNSHLMRFLATLLGDSGAGQLRKRYAIAQLQQALTSSHFFDLDGFYGAIFNASRTPEEDISAAEFNPTTDPATPDEWDSYSTADSSYRERINQLASAIAMGATAPGLLAAAEAVVACPCDIYEGFSLVDPLGDFTSYLVTDPNGDGDGLANITADAQLWEDVEALGTTWSALADDTWLGLEFATLENTGVVFRRWSDIEGASLTWAELGALTWEDVEAFSGTSDIVTAYPTSLGEGGFITQDGDFAYMSRYSFLIRPKKHYDLLFPDPVQAASARGEDEDAIRSVLNVLKPAGSRLIVNTSGVEIIVPVTISAIAADSEYWEIVSEVTPRASITANTAALYPISKNQATTVSPYSGQLMQPTDPHPLPRPAFAGYQGDEWSYASEIVNVASYSLDGAGDVLSTTNYEMVTYFDGTTVSYTPDRGVLNTKQAAAGRVASGGVVVAAPYSSARTQVVSSG